MFGPGSIFYLSPTVPSPGILLGSTFYIGPQVTFDYLSHQGESFFGCASPLSTLHFDGCIINTYANKSTLHGWHLKQGLVVFDKSVSINNYYLQNDIIFANADPTKGCVLGNNGINDVQTYLCPNAQISVLGCLIHNPL